MNRILCARSHQGPHLTSNEQAAILTLRQKVTINQVTTMLVTSKNVLFPGHNHLVTTGTNDPSLAGVQAVISVRTSVPVVSRWL